MASHLPNLRRLQPAAAITIAGFHASTTNVVASSRCFSSTGQPSLVVSIREALVPTNFSPCSERKLGNHVPLSLNDVYVIHEQLPYAYFFTERLCDKKLERSLKKVLQFFPMLGGRLCLDSLSIVLDEDDTVPFSVGRTEIPAEEWIGMRHSSPQQLLPLFDPLPRDPWNSRTPLARIRVTHMGGDNDNGGTVLGVNISHAAADGASCIHLMYCWGRQHRKLNYPKPSYDRSLVTTNGMLTPTHKDLLNLGVVAAEEQTPSALGVFSSQILGFSSAILRGTQDDSAVITSSSQSEERPAHEFVLLRFTPKLLKAMKAYGKARCSELAVAEEEGLTNEQPNFVSTNDLVTAAGWELMKEVSGRHDWGMNVVVNIRGKAATAPDFRDSGVDGGGLFGNGITAATAQTSTMADNPPSTDDVSDDEMARRNIVASARACRAALTRCYDHLPENLAASRMGDPIIAAARLGPAFCTTSWHFPLWEIDFEDGLAPVEGLVDSKGNDVMESVEDDEEHGRPFAFHGQPVHPLPPGETFSAVIVPTACRGLDYQLFLPLHHAERAKSYIQHLETLFLAE